MESLGLDDFTVNFVGKINAIYNYGRDFEMLYHLAISSLHKDDLDLAKVNELTKTVENQVIAANHYLLALALDEERKEAFDGLSKTGIYLHLNSHYGYAPSGMTPALNEPAYRGQKISDSAAISIFGVVSFCIDDRAINGNSFTNFIESQHFPSIGRSNIILMDKVRFHKIRISTPIFSSARSHRRISYENLIRRRRNKKSTGQQLKDIALEILETDRECNMSGHFRNMRKDAGLLAFLEPQDHQFNEVHFCRYFMYAFEQFLSNGIHECVFIIDNVRFHKTNRVQTMLQENGRMAIYLLPYSSFHNLIEKFVLEMEEHCKNSVPKIRNRPI
ncbi:hypothetical protein RF11_07935 [Thelohanellus kitauei]|uniref:Tc1-like transposase DDE domain-containing protein n=1 Tax=Thelohanellus kitauei TaxID=669202 RepID=A0A0C2MCM0_THEKT|nr:hypothetical protein RF11_07935 [Thelohanellus kitauei]